MRENEGQKKSEYGHFSRSVIVMDFEHKVIKCFHQVVVKSPLTNESYSFSTTRVPMTTKLDMMVTYLDGVSTHKVT